MTVCEKCHADFHRVIKPKKQSPKRKKIIT